MTVLGGYWLKVLDIDLSSGKIEKKPLPEEIAENMLGGRGFVSWLHYFNIDPEADPLGPDNALIFATGPFTGTLAPASGRFVVGGKSPLTGILGDANCGGQWGPELKYAGYDVLIVRGKAKSPVTINIMDDLVSIKPTYALWGKDTEETEKMVRNELKDDSVQVACIGIAGENLVRFAGIVCNSEHLAARTGMGAVMGSKNLKAIAVKGTKGAPLFDHKEFKGLRDELWNIITTDSRSGEHLPQYGTTSLIDLHNSLGGLSTRNWQEGYFEDHEMINGDTLNKKYLFNTTACFNCPSRCDRYSYISEGEFKGTYVGGPEYYTILSFGSKLGNNNLASVLKANQLCNQYGLDTGTTGGIIAYAMECYENGILTEEDCDGLDLSWGNYHAIIELIHKIANREGFGNVLAHGFREAVKQIGEESAKYAIHIKGMDPPTLDPRALKVYNFRYAIASRGGDHLRISAHGAYKLDELPVEEAARQLVFWQNIVTIPDLIGVCKFPYTFYSETPDVTFKKVLELVPKMITAASGIEMDKEKILRASARAHLLERSLNIRYGLKPGDDKLPERFLKEPLPTGPKKGQVYDIFDDMKKSYYQAMFWDMETGIPFEEAYQGLGLSEIAQDLKRRGYSPKEGGKPYETDS
ncbi:MAG: Aldehyde ferredoxin oxidoreductase [Clostridiales bacterium]|jgi:aldehyde:ferredoxin oxidoreductase|nr:Aldehyde ferredoxin oxidoreductase [Clostridiales bacterium]